MLVGVAAYVAKLTAQPYFGAVSAALAAGALFVAAYSAYSAVARGRRKDTLEAYSRWSDATRDARRHVSAVLGPEEITDEQASALVGPVKLKDSDGKELSDEVRQKVRSEVHDILNGLERLAIGVEFGIYDEAVLRVLAGTIIARTYERFEPYIEAKREVGTTKARQSKAFIELDVLYDMLEEPRLVETLRGRRRSIDKGRLAALRRNRR